MNQMRMILPGRFPMILSPKRGNGGHITSYTVNIGCKEARDCGFIDEDGRRADIRKTVDTDRKRIIFELETNEPGGSGEEKTKV